MWKLKRASIYKNMILTELINFQGFDYEKNVFRIGLNKKLFVYLKGR